MSHGSKDNGRVHRNKIERGLLARNKVPRETLRSRLGDAVGSRRRAVNVLNAIRVPRLLGEGGVRIKELLLGKHRGKGRRNDDAPDGFGLAVDGLEDAAGAVEGRVDELLLGVGPLVVKGAGGVKHDLEPVGVRGDDGVKGAGLGNVADGDDDEAFLLDAVWVGGADLFCLVFGADGGDDGVVFGEELFEDVGWNYMLAFSFFFDIRVVGVRAMNKE